MRAQVSIIAQYGNMGEDDAGAELQRMATQDRRYVRDIWS